MIHSQRTIEMAGIGSVRITRKSGVKRISMRIHQSGEVRVTIPSFVTYKAGELFVFRHSDWIKKQKNKQPDFIIYDSMQIGKLHTIKLMYGDTLRLRVANNSIDIQLPYSSSYKEAEIQLAIKKAIKRALQKESKQLLPKHTQKLANEYGFSFKEVNTRPMRSRWGSCSNTAVIALNCYIMMLPWDIIDYIIVHELSHTKHMHHADDFWAEVCRVMPDYKQRKKHLKSLQSSVHSFYV